MNLIKINIDCVDGTTFYSCGSLQTEKTILLDFLDKYDHEGSNLLLQIYDSDKKSFITEISNPELIYEYLRKNI